MLKAFLFDFDGTLFQVERVHQECIEEVLNEEMQITLSPEESQAFSGITYLARIEQMLALRDIRDEALVIRLEKEARKRMAARLENIANFLTPGARELLEDARSCDLRIAIVSSAAQERILEDITKAGISEYFELITALEHVVNPKPDPEAYETTLRLMQLEPQEAVVFEDSPRGAESATAAGIPVIGILTTATAEELQPALITVSDFRELTVKKILEHPVFQ